MLQFLLLPGSLVEGLLMLGVLYCAALVGRRDPQAALWLGCGALLGASAVLMPGFADLVNTIVSWGVARPGSPTLGFWFAASVTLGALRPVGLAMALLVAAMGALRLVETHEQRHAESAASKARGTRANPARTGPECP